MNFAAITRNKLWIDVDNDGVKEEVEIMETPGFRYPLLARWWKEAGNGRKRELWAVASHIKVSGDYHAESDAREALNKAEASVLDLFLESERKNPVEFRSLASLGRSRRSRRNTETPALDSPFHGFRVGPVSSAPAYRDAGIDGSMLRVLEELNAKKKLAQDTRAELDYVYFVDASREPGDPDFADHQARTFDRINAREAWALQRGDYEKVTVAVVDTGIDYRHPDLEGNIRVDEHKNLLGWDFYRGTTDPDDDHWHGTYCAGLVGAVGDNNLGMAGVNWRVGLMPIKAFSERGAGTSSHAAQAIRYAVDQQQPADVILCAWGSAGRSPEVRAALQYAATKDILVVAAAGNGEVFLDHFPASLDHFPASFSSEEDLTNVISVGAINEKDVPMPTETEAQIYAPGENVYSTFPKRFRHYLPYHTAQVAGTSAAAALVAGACALVKAELKKRNISMSAKDLRDLLVATAESKAVENVDGMPEGTPSSIKILNLEAAVKEASSHLPGGRSTVVSRASQPVDHAHA